MTDPTLADFHIQQTLPVSPNWHLMDVRRVADDSPERLTVFSPDLSCNPEFRRALKTDRAMLLMLQHQSVAKVLGTGESEGNLFLRTEPCDSTSLLSQIENGRKFSVEDIIEIGWQICSALQRAHNLGLTHGRIAADTVLCSDTLQVLIIEFGFARWLEAAARHNSSGIAGVPPGSMMSREQVERDLTDLAQFLQLLLQEASLSVASDDSTVTGLQRLLSRCLSTAPEQHPVTAREFQGRLGELLISPGAENMPVEVARDVSGGSKRSIVVNLFATGEDTNSPTLPHSPVDGVPAASASRPQFLPFLIIAVVLVIITVLAVLLR